MNQSYRIPEYEQLLSEFCVRIIPNTYYILKFMKGCGYSEIVIVPKYYTITDLVKLLREQFGTWMENTIYYIDVNNQPVFIHKLQQDMRIKDLIRNLKWAYPIDECIHNVHILYYGQCSCTCIEQCGECL